MPTVFDLFERLNYFIRLLASFTFQFSWFIVENNYISTTLVHNRRARPTCSITTVAWLRYFMQRCYSIQSRHLWRLLSPPALEINVLKLKRIDRNKDQIWLVTLFDIGFILESLFRFNFSLEILLDFGYFRLIRLAKKISRREREILIKKAFILAWWFARHK